ncbi:Hypothetical_protein [Hexamita inflata]|uniref:Hypothetical_protein n=1 Tax=Hexamita inflata TaxID=28002 RepID=A0AA86NP79_9EUKA|nr:Hypothetical protein HINF_LOCUS10238 [Hexamita inflata]
MLLFCGRKVLGTESDVEIQRRDLSGGNFYLGQFGHTGSLVACLWAVYLEPGHLWRLKWSGSGKLLGMARLQQFSLNRFQDSVTYFLQCDLLQFWDYWFWRCVGQFGGFQQFQCVYMKVEAKVSWVYVAQILIQGILGHIGALQVVWLSRQRRLGIFGGSIGVKVMTLVYGKYWYLMSILVNIRKFYLRCISRYLRLVEIVSTFGQLLEISSWNWELELAFSLPGVQIPGWNQVFDCSSPLLLPLGLAFGRLVRFSLALRLLLRDNILRSAYFLLQTRRRVCFGGSGLLFWQGTWTWSSLIVLQVAICRESKEKRSATHLGPPAFTAWQAYQHAT